MKQLAWVFIWGANLSNTNRNKLRLSSVLIDFWKKSDFTSTTFYISNDFVNDRDRKHSFWKNSRFCTICCKECLPCSGRIFTFFICCGTLRVRKLNSSWTFCLINVPKQNSNEWRSCLFVRHFFVFDETSCYGCLNIHRIRFSISMDSGFCFLFHAIPSP